MQLFRYRIWLGGLLCWLTTLAQAQTLRGVVYQYREGGTPLAGVSLSLEGRVYAVSQSNGTFVLEAADLEPGTPIRLLPSYTSAQGESWAWVNAEAWGHLTVPAEATEQIVTLVMCPQAEVDSVRLQYYGLVPYHHARLDTARGRVVRHWEQRLVSYERAQRRVLQVLTESNRQEDSLRAVLGPPLSGAVAKDLGEVRWQPAPAGSALDRLDRQVRQWQWEAERALQQQAAPLRAQYRAGDFAAAARGYQQLLARAYQAGLSVEVLAHYHTELAAVLWALEATPEAELHLDRATALQAIGHSTAEAQARTLALRGSMALAVHQYSEATDLQRKALQLRQQDSLPLLLADSYLRLGQVSHYLKLGGKDSCLYYLDQAIRTLEEAGSPCHFLLAEAYAAKAEKLRKDGDTRGAVRYWQKALALWTEALPDEHRWVARGHLGKGIAYLANGEPDKAQSLVERGLALAEAPGDSLHPQVARAHAAQGEVYLKQEQYAQALRRYQTALRLWEQSGRPRHHELPDWQIEVTKAYLALKQCPEAIAAHEKINRLAPDTGPIIRLKLLEVSAIYDQGYGTLAQEAWEAQDWAAALLYYQKLRAVKRDAYHSLRTARCYYELGQYRYAQQIYREVWAWNPPNLGLEERRLWAHTYAYTSQWEEAQSRYQQLDAQESADRSAANWALYYTLQGDRKRALRALKRGRTFTEPVRAWLWAEPGLAALREEPRFTQIVPKP